MALSLTTALANTFKKELFKGTHNFSASGGNAFKVALFKASAAGAGTYGAATTNYSEISADELANGNGYTTGGAALTNVEPSLSGSTALVDFSPDPSWTSATFSTRGCLLYNSTASGASVSVHDFGGDQSVSAGTFTLQFPTADASTAILRLA